MSEVILPHKGNFEELNKKPEIEINWTNSNAVEKNRDFLSKTFGLTKRELDVLVHMVAGKTNREVAESMCLSIGSVKTYNTSIFVKLEVKNRTQAVIKTMDSLK